MKTDPTAKGLIDAIEKLSYYKKVSAVAKNVGRATDALNIVSAYYDDGMKYGYNTEKALYSWAGGALLGNYYGITMAVTGSGIAFSIAGPEAVPFGYGIGYVLGGFYGGVQGACSAEEMYEKLYYDNWDRH
jgi:hypothetical protein